MRFVLKNINKVQEADILLKGLTVIAGENDSGKSTVGKLLFSTIKALADTDVRTDAKRDALLQKHVHSLFSRLPWSLWNKGRSSNLFPLNPDDFVRGMQQASSLKDFLQLRIEAIDADEKVTPRLRSLLLSDIENIRICMEESQNRSAALATEIQYFIESEFMNKICSYHTEGSCVKFCMDEGEAELSYSIRDDQVLKETVQVSDGEYLQDATYVESPLYVHLLDTLLFASTYREMEQGKFFRSMVPIHIKDLASKLDMMKFTLSGQKRSPIAEEVQDVVGGHFSYDAQSRSLCFSKDGLSFSPINIASGIKSFGVIQMLLDTNAINGNKILIWDEPENHLHPRWQIEFAKVLVQLAQSGIPIVISSHSPYFIQGVRYFSVKYRMEKFVNYYLANPSGGLVSMENVSSDLNRIFVKLAEPLNEIMNVDELR